MQQRFLEPDHHDAGRPHHHGRTAGSHPGRRPVAGRDRGYGTDRHGAPGGAAAGLESADLIHGSGPAAKAGDSVTVQYVLATYSSGKTIQSSWTSQPFTFTLGAGQVIPGWDQGVAGMQVGGRRELIIPPSLGYGAHSPGAGIAANDTLVFVVDLLKIN